MKVAFFDCFAGISGDMILGALIDLGLPVELLERGLAKLDVGGYRLRVGKVDKLGVMATKVDVLVGEHLADSDYHEAAHDHSHSHSHSHDHEHRGLAEILELIERSGLDPAVKQLAKEAFLRLGAAESKVHGVPMETIHFHEVGSVDAIVDIVGCAIGFDYLELEEVYASPVHLGRGMLKMAHGLYPIPGPATVNILVGVPTYQSDIMGELTTPTGAAVLTAVAKGYGPMPQMQIDRVGYGAGTKDRSIPNVLRVMVGTKASNEGTNPAQHDAPTLPSGYHEGRAVVIESNIDDMNPQFYDHLFDRLTEAGAMDVYLSGVQMKKNRPATVLHVIAPPQKVDELLTVIFTETTTIGVRTYEVTKRMLQRELRTVKTEYGDIRVKLARLGDQVVNCKPEYDDCKAAARQNGVALKVVDERARAAARLL